MNENKRSRAKHACKQCNLRRVRCDVMLKHPCSNCAASPADCLILPSRRGRYPRKPRQSGLRNTEHHPAAETPSGPPEPTPEPTSVAPRRSAPPSAPTSSPAAVSAEGGGGEGGVGGGGEGEGGRGGAGSLFFGESNFLTVISSGRSGALPATDKSRLSFPINPASTPQADHQSPPSTGVIHLSHGTERYLRDEGALAFPSLSACLTVIHAYFTWFHPCFPILDRPDIARRLPTMDVSPILFQSMLFIGATYCDEPAIVAMGFRDRSEAKSLLYTRARLLFHADSEKDQITLVQSLFLMSFWRGESSDVRDVRYWLGVAITLAETCGLHRSTKLTTRDPHMARMRRRTWWSVYVRERQSAASLGLPMRIRDEDCDIESLTVADLRDDRDQSPLTNLGSPTSEHLMYPVKMVELARLLGKIIDLHFAPGRGSTASEEVVHLQESLEEWKDSLPVGSRSIIEEDNPSIWSCLLHLAYNQLRILLFRNGFLCHDTHGTQAALGAASQVSRIAETMLERKTLQYGQMHLITSLFAALCIHAIYLKTAGGVARRLAQHRAQICLLGLKEVQKFWRINNTVLDLFLQYLDRPIARRLGGDHVDRDSESDAIPVLAAVSGCSNTPNLPTETNLSPPETNSFEDHYYNILSMNWEGEKAIDDLGLILDPRFQTHSPVEGGPAQVDGLNLLERRL